MARTESKIEEFSEDLSKMLRQARTKAEGWLGQRQKIAKQLAGIRDAASDLLRQLTGGGADMAVAVRRGRRGRPVGSRNKVADKKRRKPMSKAARAKIAAAQKARWAKQKAEKK